MGSFPAGLSWPVGSNTRSRSSPPVTATSVGKTYVLPVCVDLVGEQFYSLSVCTTIVRVNWLESEMSQLLHKYSPVTSLLSRPQTAEAKSDSATVTPNGKITPISPG
jgi:hypothetical protein